MQHTGQLERGLSKMNHSINYTIEYGIMSVQQLERNTKNMVASQQSRFYQSKYEQSKLLSSFNFSKLDQSKVSKMVQSKNESPSEKLVQQE